MEIHPPDGPAHSLRDFAIHILIVTTGILIALGLEGVRETWREHNAVAEARESFRRELRTNQSQLQLELASVKVVHHDLDGMLAVFDQSAKTPVELTEKVVNLTPGFYFFSTTAWESALATGVLAHMKAEELTRFADAYLSVKNYQDAQKAAIPDWIAAKAFFSSHHSLDPAGRVAGEEKLRLLQMKIEILQHLAGEFTEGLKNSLGTHP